VNRVLREQIAGIRDAVVSAVDAASIYDIPKVLHTEGLDAYVVRRLGLPFHVDDMVGRCREALASTHENKLRVQATFSAFFDFVSSQGEAFRLVFESDLRNVAPVRQRVERSLRECAEMVSAVIQEDTGCSSEEAHLLGVGLVGMAEVSARYWVTTHGSIPKDAAEQLMARLAWRGISGFPRTT
ncbi:hypothetical protein AB0K48_54485, partial [Nonomuraea sp. NPDC055795]